MDYEHGSQLCYFAESALRDIDKYIKTHGAESIDQDDLYIINKLCARINRRMNNEPSKDPLRGLRPRSPRHTHKKPSFMDVHALSTAGEY